MSWWNISLSAPTLRWKPGTWGPWTFVWKFLRSVDLRIPRRNEIAPILAAAALAAVAVLQVQLPLTPELPQTSTLAPRRVPAVDTPPSRDYPSMLGAALFAPDRPRVPGILDIAGTLEGYRVLGIATAGHLVSAVVQGPGGTVTRVAMGRTLDGWLLIGADQSRMVFSRGKEQRVLLVNSN